MRTVTSSSATMLVGACLVALTLLSSVRSHPTAFVASPSDNYGSGSTSYDSIDIPLKGFMRVSDEVIPGHRAEKYRVPSLTHWPDGSPAPKEQAPYVIIAVPNDEYTRSN